MASSRPSRNAPDLSDVYVTWRALEEINKVTITIALGVAPRGVTPELLVNALAWDNSQENMEAPPLVLANAKCWAFDHQSLDIALFHLLYTLDGRIAEAELLNADKKGA